jgi:hypothetical protein
MDNTNADKSLEDLYPTHFQAIRKANLISAKVPTLREEMVKVKERIANKGNKLKTSEAELKKKREDLERDQLSFVWAIQKLQLPQSTN